MPAVLMASSPTTAPGSAAAKVMLTVVLQSGPSLPETGSTVTGKLLQNKAGRHARWRLCRRRCLYHTQPGTLLLPHSMAVLLTTAITGYHSQPLLLSVCVSRTLILLGCLLTCPM